MFKVADNAPAAVAAPHKSESSESGAAFNYYVEKLKPSLIFIKSPAEPATGAALNVDSSASSMGQVPLTISGFNFEIGSKAQMGNLILDTTCINANTLTALLPDSISQTIGDHSIKVVNSDTGDVSNIKVFRVLNAGHTVFLPLMPK